MPHPLEHGIQSYFGEFAANRRRVATVLVAVSAALGALIALSGRQVAHELLDNPERYGFEGPKQWVDRIRLEERANRESPGIYEITYLTAESRKGGQKRAAPT